MRFLLSRGGAGLFGAPIAMAPADANELTRVPLFLIDVFLAETPTRLQAVRAQISIRIDEIDDVGDKFVLRDV